MNSLLFIILVILYFYMIVSAISVLLLENRNPVRSLSWVLVLVLLPVIGIVLYLLIGQNYRKQKIISKKSIKHETKLPYKELKPEAFPELVSNSNHLNLINLLYKNSDATVYAYNKIDVLADGEATFTAMFEAIKNAQNHIHIEFFIFEDDRISNYLRELLIEKAKAGVRVRMIYDYLGSYGLSRKYLQSLTDAGVYVRPFLPLRLRLRRSKINFRNHRKILIVDGKYGFTGGLNFADRYLFGNTLGKWRDTFVRFEGAAVHGMQSLFLTDWYFIERKLITDIKYYPKPVKHDKNLVQIVSSGPDSDWESIMQGIASAIMSAHDYTYLHTPYFVPNDIILNAVIIAALSGIDVKLMIPSESDSKLSDACTFSYLGEILEAGVKVYQYKEGFLHSKAIVIDDFISIVGSANLDERSFNQNFEANAFIYDATTSLKLKKLFETDILNSKEITLNDWHNRKRSQKLKESFARLFSPII
ncbi:MAG: cardiolipin synthase [Paludibacter sp.]|nr:cardiolipin synthase [Paludibacter sp.]MDD4199500.1 cardiolipin synthase [Paludibacter sp.]MDD4428710.1 cardiolipin synthase [Paludibacter sp.]